MATLPQGNQELLVVRDKVWRPPGELGLSKPMECDIFHLGFSNFVSDQASDASTPFTSSLITM